MCNSSQVCLVFWNLQSSCFWAQLGSKDRAAQVPKGRRQRPLPDEGQGVCRGSCQGGRPGWGESQGVRQVSAHLLGALGWDVRPRGARGHFLSALRGHWFMILKGYTLNFTNPVLPEIRMRQGHPDYQGRRHSLPALEDGEGEAGSSQDPPSSRATRGSPWPWMSPPPGDQDTGQSPGEAPTLGQRPRGGPRSGARLWGPTGPIPSLLAWTGRASAQSNASS